MSSAWIGFVGVVVGALVSTLWQWLAVVRQELSEAVVAARLVDESLRAAAGTAKPDPSIWIENRVALAKALGRKQWDAVASVYREGGASEEQLKTAREAIARLVQGKRHVLVDRLHNLFD